MRFKIAIERDHTAERLARIDALLAETNRTMVQVSPMNHTLMRKLADQLDEMLNELLGTFDVARRRA